MTRDMAESGIPDGMMEVIIGGKPVLRKISHYAQADGPALGSRPEGPLLAWPTLEEGEVLYPLLGGKFIIV